MAKWKLRPRHWCHIEVLSGDVERSTAFYLSVFNWVEPLPGTDDVNVRTSEDGIEGGIGAGAGDWSEPIRDSCPPRAASGEVEYEAAWNAGLAMSVDQAAQEAQAAD